MVGAELCERLQRRRRLQKREHGEVLRNNCTVEVGGRGLSVKWVWSDE